MARFRIDEILALEPRNLSALGGEIIDGVVERGMLIHIPSELEFTMTTLIHSIDFIDGAAGAKVGLTMPFQGTDNLALWRDLNLGNETNEVSADAA